MKIGLVTKVIRRNKQLQKKFDDDVMSENCDVDAIFFNLRPNLEESKFGPIVYKTYISINSNLLSYKNWKQN